MFTVEDIKNMGVKTLIQNSGLNGLRDGDGCRFGDVGAYKDKRKTVISYSVVYMKAKEAELALNTFNSWLRENEIIGAQLTGIKVFVRAYDLYCWGIERYKLVIHAPL